MRSKNPVSIVWFLAMLMGLSSSLHSGALAQSGGKVIPLPQADREYVEKHLGRGIVGKAVAARPIGDIVEFLDLDKNKVVMGRIVFGDDKGKTVRVDVQSIARQEGRPAWKRTVGTQKSSSAS